MKTIIDDINFLKENNTSQNVSEKVQAVERLATNSYYLATMVADAYEEKNSTEYMWKSSVNSAVVMKGGAVGKAEIEAKDAYKDLYKKHLEADSKYRRMSLLLAQTNVIIEQTRQSISYLKQEMRHAV